MTNPSAQARRHASVPRTAPRELHGRGVSGLARLDSWGGSVPRQKIRLARPTTKKRAPLTPKVMRLCRSVLMNHGFRPHLIPSEGKAAAARRTVPKATNSTAPHQSMPALWLARRRGGSSGCGELKP